MRAKSLEGESKENDSNSHHYVWASSSVPETVVCSHVCRVGLDLASSTSQDSRSSITQPSRASFLARRPRPALEHRARHGRQYWGLHRHRPTFRLTDRYPTQSRGL